MNTPSTHCISMSPASALRLLPSCFLARPHSSSRLCLESVLAPAYRPARKHCSSCRMSAAHAPMCVPIHLPVYSRCDFVQLIVWRIGQGVDIGCQAGGGGCIDAGDMVVYAYLCQVLARGSFYRYYTLGPSSGASITCLLTDLTGCLMRWTRSGGPSSRSVERLSVLISTTECASSSNNLGGH